MNPQKPSFKDIMQDWQAYGDNITRATPVPLDESALQKAQRKKELLKDFEAFCKYYFPNYTTSEFADFQKEAAKAFIDNENIYAVFEFARDHAKSVLAMFLILYLKCKGEKMVCLYVSHSSDNAEKLLMPLMLQLEKNQRLIHDYGVQKSWKQWEKGYFVCNDGSAFMAFGWTQGIRGTRVEDVRPTLVITDDLDFDEDIHNPERSDKKWEFVEKSLIPTVSIDKIGRKLFLGNRISDKGIIARAAEKADYHKVVNILDENGNVTWHQRFTLEQVLKRQNEMSYFAFQSEYMNNPIRKGTTFKEMVWGKVPPLSKFKFLVEYCDPSYKDHKKSDYKAKVLMGELNGKFYIIRAFVEQTSVANMVDWSYQIEDFVAGKTALYRYMESVLLQDIFFEEFRKEGKKRGRHLALSPDDRKKPDKFHRIESNLEPLNRRGDLIFNIEYENDPHFKRLEEQFLALSPNSKAKDDGPDAVEGAVWIINNKLREMRPILVTQAKRNKKRY